MIDGLYWGSLFRYVCRQFSVIDQDDAKDIVEGVFIKLWLKREEVAAWDRPRDWLFGAAWNDGQDYLKRRVRRKQDPLEVMHLDIPDTVEEPDERLDKALEAITRLPPEMRKVMELKYIQGLDNREIKEESGKSYQTVSNQLAKRLKRIKGWLRVEKTDARKSGESKEQDND